MGSHAYAFKFNNKTLGIKDVDQLKRLLDSGKISEDDSVFVIDFKRWVKISHLPDYSRLVASEAEGDVEVAEDKMAEKPAELTPHVPRTKAFARLIDELDDNEDNADETHSGDQAQSTSGRDAEDFAPVENVKTIHRMAKTRNNRMETMVAAKVPVSESSWGSTTAIAATAILVLLLGIVAGFLGASTIQEETMPQKVNTVLQANTGIPAGDKN